MLSVTNIQTIIYSKCYHSISHLSCLVDSINLSIRTEMNGYIEKINIRIGSNTNIVESRTISLNDFKNKCIEAYPQHQVAINRMTYFDIESLLKLLYSDIDDILASHIFKDSEFLTIYKNVPLDCSKLNALVSQFLTVDKVNQIMNKIDHENQAREARIRKWYVKSDSAEGDNLSVIDLNLDELKAVKRFCDAEVIEEDYGGTDYIYDKYPFRTKDEAIAAIKESITCRYQIESILKKRSLN